MTQSKTRLGNASHGAPHGKYFQHADLHYNYGVWTFLQMIAAPAPGPWGIDARAGRRRARRGGGVFGFPRLAHRVPQPLARTSDGTHAERQDYGSLVIRYILNCVQHDLSCEVATIRISHRTIKIFRMTNFRSAFKHELQRRGNLCQICEAQSASLPLSLMPFLHRKFMLQQLRE